MYCLAKTRTDFDIVKRESFESIFVLKRNHANGYYIYSLITWRFLHVIT